MDVIDGTFVVVIPDLSQRLIGRQTVLSIRAVCFLLYASQTLARNRQPSLQICSHRQYSLVPGAGIEPARPEGHGILSPERLPVPPPRLGPILPPEALAGPDASWNDPPCSDGRRTRPGVYCFEMRSDEMQSLNPGLHGPLTTSRSETSAT